MLGANGIVVYRQKRAEMQALESEVNRLQKENSQFAERINADFQRYGRVMKELGLTKGGFYRHFRSKGDLYAAAVARAFAETGSHHVAVAETAPKGQELRAIIEHYLSSDRSQTDDDVGFDCREFRLKPRFAGFDLPR